MKPKIFLSWLLLSILFAGVPLLAEESAALTLEKATDLRAKGNNSKAETACLSLLKSAKLDDALKKAALLELAACRQFDKGSNRCAKAAESYREFLKLWPDDPLAAKAHFNLARCLELASEGSNVEEARNHYQIVYGEFPGSIWADQAYFWEAMSHSNSLNKETAAKTVEMLKDFDSKFPSSPLKGVSAAELSELACSYLDDIDLAIESGLKALSFGLQSQELKSRILYRLAYLYQFKKGDLAKAAKYYQELVDSSPTKSDPNYFVALKRMEEFKAINPNPSGEATR